MDTYTGPDGVPWRDGAPLWDVLEWGTRGPPWRGSLLHPQAPLPDDGPIGAPDAPLGERPGMRDTIDRMTRRIMEHSPIKDPYAATERARACAARHDRRNGR